MAQTGISLGIKSQGKENFKYQLDESRPSKLEHLKAAPKSLSERPIDIEDLYPSSPVLRPELVTAFRLLEEGLKQITHAVDAEKEGDRISSDDAIHRLQALLPELFCCRTIGDGFGAIINAVYHAIINMKGTPLNARQLHFLNKVLRRISTEPFLQFNEAVDEIISLEEVGFEVEPSHYKYAADILE